MKISRAIELMEIERECVSRDCDRDCEKCDISQDRDELLEAYNEIISAARYFQLSFSTE